MTAAAQPPDDAAARAQDEVADSDATLHPLVAGVIAPLESLAETTGLAEQVRANPTLVLSIAAGIGFIAGGGLSSKSTTRLADLAVKAASVPWMQRQALGFLESALDTVLQHTEVKPKP